MTEKRNKLWIPFSGGLDSVCMMELLKIFHHSAFRFLAGYHDYPLYKSINFFTINSDIMRAGANDLKYFQKYISSRDFNKDIIALMFFYCDPESIVDKYEDHKALIGVSVLNSFNSGMTIVGDESRLYRHCMARFLSLYISEGDDLLYGISAVDDVNDVTKLAETLAANVECVYNDEYTKRVFDYPKILVPLYRYGKTAEYSIIGYLNPKIEINTSIFSCDINSTDYPLDFVRTEKSRRLEKAKEEFDLLQEDFSTNIMKTSLGQADYYFITELSKFEKGNGVNIMKKVRNSLYNGKISEAIKALTDKDMTGINERELINRLENWKTTFSKNNIVVSDFIDYIKSQLTVMKASCKNTERVY